VEGRDAKTRRRGRTMTRGIDKRVRHLEAIHGREPCEECGFDGDTSKVNHVVEWVDPAEIGPGESAWCQTCGRPLKIVVSFNDPRDPWRAA
jgi:hypothetical protein